MRSRVPCTLLQVLPLFWAGLGMAADLPASNDAQLSTALNHMNPGDTIILAAGIYAGPIVLNTDNVKLQGNAGTIINIVQAGFGTAASGIGIDIAATGIVISGVEIRGPYAARSFTQIDWNLEGSSIGIQVRPNTSATIKNSVVRDTRTGISVLQSASAVSITGNLIDNTEGSIFLRSDALVSNNSTGVTGNEWDIEVLASLYPAAPIALKILPDQSSLANYGIAVMELSAGNGGMSVLDRRFADSNRSHIFIKQGFSPGPLDDIGPDNGLGNLRQPYGAVQHGITAVVPYGRITVYPGSYTEGHTHTSLGGTMDAGEVFGLHVYKDGITLQGVDMAGRPIAGPDLTQATITAAHVSGFQTAHFVFGDNVTINGLRFLTKPGEESKNLEVVGNNFTLRNSVIDNVGEGGEYGTIVLYMSEFGLVEGKVKDVETFTIENNNFVAGPNTDRLVVLANGAGNASAKANRIFRNNSITGNQTYEEGIRFAGVVPGFSHLALQVGAVTIEGNTFTDLAIPVFARGLDLPDMGLNEIFTSNTFKGGAALAYAGSTNTARVKASPYQDTSVTPAANYNLNWSAITAGLQDAMYFAQDGDTVKAKAGIYGGDLAVTKALALDGGGRAASIQGSLIITSAASGATITGFDITNPTGSAGIEIIGASNVSIRNNSLHDIGTAFTGSTQAITVLQGSASFNNITIANNTINNVGNAGSTGSTMGIYIGDSIATNLLSNIVITGNAISGIKAGASACPPAISDITCKGAYGILVNYGFSGTGTVDRLVITNNTIAGLSGGWVRAIGLEAVTTNSSVTFNTISDLSAPLHDEAAIFFEGNSAAATVILQNNKLTGGKYGVALATSMPANISVDAEHNWWGAATSPAARVSGSVNFTPWFLDAGLTTLYSVPLPPESTPTEKLNIIISGAVIPGAGGNITDQTVATISVAADRSTTLVADIVTSIVTTDTGSTLDTLAVITKIISVSGQAVEIASSQANTQSTASLVDSGAQSLNSFATLLDAIDHKVKNLGSNVALSPAQKDQVQQYTLQNVASAGKIIDASTNAVTSNAIMDTVGKITTSNLDLGVVLNTVQKTALVDMANKATDSNASLETRLGTGISVKPENKGLISAADLTVALAGSGVTSDRQNSFLAYLGASINPSDVALGNKTGKDSINDGLDSIDKAATFTFDAKSGTAFFTFGGVGSTTVSPVIGHSIFALTMPKTIPARIITTSVVSSSVPTGTLVLADGSVVITSDNISSTLVPASYDAIGLFADLSKYGSVVMDDSGRLSVFGTTFRFSGTFDFAGVIVGQSTPVVATVVNPPMAGTDEANVAFFYSLTYRDGVQQVVQPYIHDDGFVSSLRSYGLEPKVDRNNGVIAINGAFYRPSYFVYARDAAAVAQWNAGKDQSGLSYRSADLNGDGTLDVEVISATGMQAVYRLK